MPWWGWIVVGTLLLGAELFVIPTDFFLVFLGTSAIAVGAIAWTGLVGSASVEWLLFAALSLISLVFFRARFARRMATAANPRVDDTLAGERGTARETIAPGALGRVELRGTPWSARNVGDVGLAAGEGVRVERVEGLTLFVRRAE
jgi:membrane protein implicated in regulation of membrane protease activity